MKRIMSVLAIAAVAVFAANVDAAVISVQPSIAGYFDTAFNPIPAPASRPGGGTDNTGAPTVVAVDIHLSVQSLDAGEDSLGTAAFTIAHSGNPGFLGQIEPNVDVGGYAAYPYPNVDSNGALPGGSVPLFANNADLGTSSTDLVGILVQMATGAFTNAADPRRNVGEPDGVTLPSGDSLASPVLLGTAYLTWNGLGAVNITLDPVQVSAKLTNGQFLAGTAPPSAVLTIGNDIPEPSSLMLLGSCLAGVVLRRRAA